MIKLISSPEISIIIVLIIVELITLSFLLKHIKHLEEHTDKMDQHIEKLDEHTKKVDEGIKLIEKLILKK